MEKPTLMSASYHAYPFVHASQITSRLRELKREKEKLVITENSPGELCTPSHPYPTASGSNHFSMKHDADFYNSLEARIGELERLLDMQVYIRTNQDGSSLP